MGNPRIISRPALVPKGGTGTGGSGTGGVAAGGYDRYIGTLGLAKDAPSNGGFPHSLDFPAGNPRDWVNAVSTMETASGTQITNRQEWVCKKTTPAGNPSNWELRYKGNDYFRPLDPLTNIVALVGGRNRPLEYFNVPTNYATFILFQNILINGLAVYRFYSPPRYLIDVTDFLNDKYDPTWVGIAWDVSLIMNWQTDQTGDRSTRVWFFTYESNPDPSILYGNIVETFQVQPRTEAAAKDYDSTINLARNKILIPYNRPDPAKTYRYAFAVSVFQNSGVTLECNLVEICLTAYEYQRWG